MQGIPRKTQYPSKCSLFKNCYINGSDIRNLGKLNSWIWGGGEGEGNFIK
jgi:hypothetical protein